MAETAAARKDLHTTLLTLRKQHTERLETETAHVRVKAGENAQNDAHLEQFRRDCEQIRVVLAALLRDTSDLGGCVGGVFVCARACVLVYVCVYVCPTQGKIASTPDPRALGREVQRDEKFSRNSHRTNST